MGATVVGKDKTCVQYLWSSQRITRMSYADLTTGLCIDQFCRSLAIVHDLAPSPQLNFSPIHS